MRERARRGLVVRQEIAVMRLAIEGAVGRFRRGREQDADHQIEVVGRKLRAMMPWIGDKAAVKPGV